MSNDLKIKEAKETIRDWVSSINYPEEYQSLFKYWVLLNLYYNELSDEKNEVDRVLSLGRAESYLFGALIDEASEIVRTECVGNGKLASAPDAFVKEATLHLRKTLKINSDEICIKCRPDKKAACQQVTLKNYSFDDMEALIRIVYQIRCNLFHGDKTEVRDKFQMERDRELARLGSRIVQRLLFSIKL
jgi:hypothetical protein